MTRLHFKELYTFSIYQFLMPLIDETETWNAGTYENLTVHIDSARKSFQLSGSSGYITVHTTHAMTGTYSKHSVQAIKVNIILSLS